MAVRATSRETPPERGGTGVRGLFVRGLLAPPGVRTGGVETDRADRAHPKRVVATKDTICDSLPLAPIPHTACMEDPDRDEAALEMLAEMRRRGPCGLDKIVCDLGLACDPERAGDVAMDVLAWSAYRGWVELIVLDDDVFDVPETDRGRRSVDAYERRAERQSS